MDLFFSNIFDSSVLFVAWLMWLNTKQSFPLSIWTWFLQNSSLKFPVWWTGFLVYFKLEFYRLQQEKKIQFKLGKKSSLSNWISQSRELQKPNADRLKGNWLVAVHVHCTDLNPFFFFQTRFLESYMFKSFDNSVLQSYYLILKGTISINKIRNDVACKVHIFREGHKILQNFHLTFVLCSTSQK